jgi:outer membrane receptor protein involved in Fe transport
MMMRNSKTKAFPRRIPRTPLAAAIMLACPALLAQDRGGLEEIVVTAQKRSENLQDVPISIQALGNEALTELNIRNFKDYVQMLPTVTMQPSLGAGAGFAAVYMRGVATGTDGQATTSQPSVGMYLDEQPITTVQGNLDIHMYDIERIEALAGPQGTLYGASSQAGTIRIITNKPDASAFDAGFAVEGNMVDEDDTGYVVEGFVNVPLTDIAAIRLVGWARRDGGYVDNVKGTRTFRANEDHDPDSDYYCGPAGSAECAADDITINNDRFAEDNYNTLDTFGGRAALRVDVNDDWAVTPTLQYQKQEGKGAWGDDLSDFVKGDNAVTHFSKEYANDEWYQVGLTIEGKIGNFDLVYSGNYLSRDVDGSFDYSDYSYFYDSAYTSGYFSSLHFDNNGDPIPPNARYTNNDGYSKQSHELRVSSPQDRRFRGLLGLFWQEQKHDFQQNFLVAGLADSMLMNYFEGDTSRYADTVYLNSMDRVDTDEAVFGSLSFDITDTLELTVGARFFKPEVTVEGFFGYGLGFNPARVPGTGSSDGTGEPGDPNNGGEGAYSPDGFAWSRNGEWRCPSQADYKDAPCKNVDKGISESEHIGRVNLTWKISDDYMVYGTWSEGYRPGGINRNPFVGDFLSDFLTNWEAGWKTQWFDNTLQFNGAVFLEQWDKFQRSFQGANGITQVDNGPDAEILGTELQMLWMVTDNLRISAAAAYYDSELQGDFTEIEDGEVVVSAPEGSPLPITPEFKGNVVARYTFPLGSFEANAQGSLAYESSRPSTLGIEDNIILGDLPSSTVIGLSTGIAKDSWTVELFVQNLTNEDAALGISTQCATGFCGVQPYALRLRPRTIGIQFSQEF